MNVDAVFGGEHQKASAAFAMLAVFMLVHVPDEVLFVFECEIAFGARQIPSRTVDLALDTFVDRREFVPRHWHLHESVH